MNCWPQYCNRVCDMHTVFKIIWIKIYFVSRIKYSLSMRDIWDIFIYNHKGISLLSTRTKVISSNFIGLSQYWNNLYGYSIIQDTMSVHINNLINQVLQKGHQEKKSCQHNHFAPIMNNRLSTGHQFILLLHLAYFLWSKLDEYEKKIKR